jgi:hypothetical protein
VPPSFVVPGGQQDGIATVEVSGSPQADADGVFTDNVWSAGYDSSGGSIRVSPARSSSADRFWNKSGTYYWHAYRVDCPSVGPRPHTCRQRLTTPTRSFTIAPHAFALSVANVGGKIRAGDPLRLRLGCSDRCRVTVTVAAPGRRLVVARDRLIAATIRRYSFRLSTRQRQLLGRARPSVRLRVEVTAHNRYGQAVRSRA